jgi:hypothetical protein
MELSSFESPAGDAYFRVVRITQLFPTSLNGALDFLAIEAYLLANSAKAKDEAFRSFSSEGASIADLPKRKN